KILLRGLPPVFSGHRPEHGSTSQFMQSIPQVYWMEHLTGWFSPLLLAKALVDRASQGSPLQPLEQVRRRPGRASSRLPTPSYMILYRSMMMTNKVNDLSWAYRH